MAKQQKEKSYRIEWSASARKSFFSAIEYISDFSLQGAESVIQHIEKAIYKASINPGFYPPDKWKLNNKGDYRAFEIKRFRISYKIIESRKLIKYFSSGIVSSNRRCIDA